MARRRTTRRIAAARSSFAGELVLAADTFVITPIGRVADLTRALARLGKMVAFDAIWLASYGDAKASRGRCQVRADLQRPLAGRQALVVDDVVDSGLSLSEAARLVRDAGAREVITCVFARKPWPRRRAIEPDLAAWDAPARFLVGYGMDRAGQFRGLPYIAAVD